MGFLGLGVTGVTSSLGVSLLVEALGWVLADGLDAVVGWVGLVDASDAITDTSEGHLGLRIIRVLDKELVRSTLGWLDVLVRLLKDHSLSCIRFFHIVAELELCATEVLSFN